MLLDHVGTARLKVRLNVQLNVRLKVQLNVRLNVQLNVLQMDALRHAAQCS